MRTVARAVVYGEVLKRPGLRRVAGCHPEDAAERQQLLRVYWEASEQEREEGAKQPTAAHKAIALLVTQGFVKVIVTTNFDRLMETALAEVGIVPTVLSIPDQVHGELPLIHVEAVLAETQLAVPQPCPKQTGW